MPSPKENELIEKVIEFDQSIETNFRERETCATNGLRFCLFFMRSKQRQHSSPFCYITLRNKITLHCLSLSLSLSLSLISKSKTKSYLEPYGDHLAWDFWMLLNSTVTCFEIQKNFVLGLGSLLNYMSLYLFNWAIIIKILKLI